MGTPNTLLSLLYLLMYSSFSTADLSIAQVTQIEKGMSTTKELLTGMQSLGTKLTEKSAQAGESLSLTLKVFSGVSKVASSLGFIGALVGFVVSFLPQADPKFEFIKQQFSEVNRKLDSIFLHISSLEQSIDWANYASVYGRDEYNIKNSWDKWIKLIEMAPLAKDEETKRRLVQEFTNYYENHRTEGSVDNFYRYITERSTVSLNKNLLDLVVDKFNGDFKILTKFSSHFTALMVSGLQLNLYYYALKDYDVAPRVKETATKLVVFQKAVQDVLIKCGNDFRTWAKKDVEKIGTQSQSNTESLASDIKKHLDEKFNFYDWTVIVHNSDAQNERIHGNATNLTVQNKAIHLIHREKGHRINNSIKMKMVNEWKAKGDKSCSVKTSGWPNIFSSSIMENVEFMHDQTDYVDTVDEEYVKLTCPHQFYTVPSFYHVYGGQTLPTAWTTFKFYVKRKLVEKPPCSGCPYQNLQWVPTLSSIGIPQDTVRSKKGYHVCRAKHSDGWWHGGWIWTERNTCNYEWDWKEHRATAYEVLVDPCGGKGVEWKESAFHRNTVSYADQRYVCSVMTSGVTGKLFLTRNGWMCHIGYEGKGDRHSNFYSLVTRGCV